jgi:hypothetical protein
MQKKEGEARGKKSIGFLHTSIKMKETYIYIWHQCFTYANVNKSMRHVYIIIQFIKKRIFN